MDQLYENTNLVVIVHATNREWLGVFAGNNPHSSGLMMVNARSTIGIPNVGECTSESTHNFSLNTALI